jgi:hypothetical protein
LNQNIIGRFPDGGQIIHQGARPIKNNVPNHTRNVTARGIAVMEINSVLKRDESRKGQTLVQSEAPAGHSGHF